MGIITDYDTWKSTEPREQPRLAPTKVSEYDVFQNTLDARLLDEGFQNSERIIEIVDRWLAEIESGWRNTNDDKALRWANNLRTLRLQSLRNKHS